MTRGIIVAFHKYQPYGSGFYEPILDFYLKNMRKYIEEYDKIYLIDSNWNIDLFNKYKSYNTSTNEWNVEVIKVNPSLRYYDAYKEVLPQIKEDLVLFMDNDMVVYRKRIIDETFRLIELGVTDIVSIYDSIGEYKTDKLNGKNKLCPYWFSTKTAILRQYTNCEWGPDMPFCETFGHLTEKMIENGLRIYEWKEDKKSVYFDEHLDPATQKNLGYYHIRAGSVPALLLAYRQNDPDKYWEYLKTQPKREYLRQCAWYHHMELETLQEPTHTWDIIRDLKINQADWTNYMNKFKKFHGL